MARKERKVRDNVGSYNESCEYDNACTKGYMAYFGVQNLLKILKENPEKRKTAEFRKRISAKTAFFSVFKSVNLVGKSDDTLTIRARHRRARIVI